MKFSNPNSEFYIPYGATEEQALKRATHIGIGAHQDDLEIMAFHAIVKCFHSATDKFLGITVTNGSGSPRAGLYAKTTDEEMQAVRRQEQKKAAQIGEYSGVILLNHASKDVKNPAARAIVDDLKQVLAAARPSVVCLHNLADKHDTHIGVAVKAIKAMRELSADARPKRVYGCEVWRNLDWMQDAEKVVFDISNHENMAAALLGLYDSQIAGGKRYDLANMGRWRANASFFASHDTDTSTALSYAMDLTPLVDDPKIDLNEYVQGYIGRFAKDVADRIRTMS